MELKSFTYAELVGTPREWSSSQVELQKINLFVGRNASGKSRLLNIVFAISSLISKPPEKLWSSGSWDCRFTHKKDEYSLKIKLQDSNIAEEFLSLNGRVLLERNIEGEGHIWAEKLQQNLEFKVPKTTLVIHNRKDELQHPFLEPIFAWATSVRKYSFGTEFGKQFAFVATPDDFNTPSDEPAKAIDPNKVVQVYFEGFSKYGDSFDDAILSDFAEVGYDCNNISSLPITESIEIPEEAQTLLMGRLPMVLSVQEKDLPGPTRQHDMSMGMYRALALLINLNFTIRSHQADSIIVDDIGEGLDFERSISLINLLVRKCAKEKIQLIMTTNDRFIMNEVDLKWWHIVHRKSNHIKVLDYKNSQKTFDDFKFLGMSNFDFFSRDAYLEGDK